LAVSVPPILVQGNADAIDVPIFDRLLKLRHHSVATGRTVRRALPIPKNQDSPRSVAHGASPLARDDLVTDKLLVEEVKRAPKMKKKMMKMAGIIEIEIFHQEEALPL